MITTVFLVRSGITDWHRDRKIAGYRDVPLNGDGVGQAAAAAAALGDVALADIVSSPILRAVQTAEAIAKRAGSAINRDPRLGDLKVGRWEGLGYDDVARSADIPKLMSDPLVHKLPGGEDLRMVRDRAVAAVAQTLRDTPTGEAIAVVTHGGVCRLLLCHYLGFDLAMWHRVPVAPGSISTLCFRDDRTPPRVHTIGWRPSLGLKEILAHG